MHAKQDPQKRQTRIDAMHANHRRARQALLVVVAAWGVLLVTSHRRGPHPVALAFMGLLTLANVALYLRGALLCRRLLPEVTASSTCQACHADLWDSLRAQAHACPQCDAPIPAAQYERLFGDPRPTEG